MLQTQNLQKEINEIIYSVKNSNSTDYYILDSCLGISDKAITFALDNGLIKEKANGCYFIPETPKVENTEETNNHLTLKLRDEKIILDSKGFGLRKIYTGSYDVVVKEARLLSIGCEKINRVVKARKNGDNGCYLLIVIDYNCINCNTFGIVEDKFCSDYCKKQFIQFNY